MTIQWKGGIALASAAVIAILLFGVSSTAAPGDSVYISCVPDCATGEVLTGAEKTALKTNVLAAFAGSVATSIKKLDCVVDSSDVWKCIVVENRTITEAAYLDTQLAGRDLKIVSHASPNVTYKDRSKVTLTAGQVSTWQSWAGGVFPTIDESVISHLNIWRSEADILLQVSGHTTGTPAQWTTDKMAGKVRETTGKVQ